MKKTIVNSLSVLFLAVACLALTGAEYSGVGDKKYELKKAVGGVTLDIIVFSSIVPGEQIPGIVDQAFGVIGTAMEWFKDDGSRGQLDLAPEGFAALKKVLQISADTGGLYDITTASLRDLWASARQRSEPPTQDQVKAALAQTGSSYLELDEPARKVKINRPGLRLDWNDSAQEVAMDKAAEFLKKSGVTSAVIEGAGTVVLLGLPPGGRSWRVSIEHPRTVDRNAAQLEIPSEGAVATVGDYEGFFIYKAKRYAGLIDPRSGFPPTYQVSSVTVTAKSALMANIAAKSFFILGPEKGYELLERWKGEGTEAVCIEENTQNKLSLSSSDGAREWLKDIQL